MLTETPVTRHPHRLRRDRYAKVHRRPGRHRAPDLYEIVHAQYQRGSIIITSNRSPSEWLEVFGNPLMASAALDRLTHHARITIIKGESYRQKSRRSGKESEATQERIIK